MLSVLWEVLLSTRGFVRLYMGYGVKELSRVLSCMMGSSLVNSWVCSFVYGLWNCGVSHYPKGRWRVC